MGFRHRLHALMKLAVWNIVVGAFLVITIELVFGDWFGPTPRSGQYACFDQIVHHKYCPGIHHRGQLSGPDGGNFVSTFVNNDGFQVEHYSDIAVPTVVSDHDLLLIGDSFVQADEMKYAQRVGAHLQKLTGLSVLSHGFSSWAPAIVSNWLRSHSLRAGQMVLYFVVVNDFTPGYIYNNLGYHDMAYGTVDVDGQSLLKFVPPNSSVPTVAPPIGYSPRIRSFFASRWDSLQNPYKESEQKPGYELIDASFVDGFEKCDAFTAKINSLPVKSLTVFDYIVFSQDRRCWPVAHKKTVASAVEDIKKAKTYLDGAGASLHVFLIPPGWSFPGENVLGKATDDYRLTPTSLVSQRGLAEALMTDLGSSGIGFTDLEPIIFHMKKSDSENWYFPVDGHWTPHTHEQIATFLVECGNRCGLPR